MSSNKITQLSAPGLQLFGYIRTISILPTRLKVSILYYKSFSKLLSDLSTYTSEFGLIALKMGNKVTRTDFEWTDSPEPHNQRRREILSKFGNILKKLRSQDFLMFCCLSLIIREVPSNQRALWSGSMV